MTRVAFVVGHEDDYNAPSDTPEAYWRVLVPARRFGIPLILGHRNAVERALAADVVWIHQPTCFAAARLAEQAAAIGKPVVVDWSEDLRLRGEVDQAYPEARLDAAEQTMTAASIIVCASRGLAEAYRPCGEVRIVEPVIPLGAEWDPVEPTVPPLMAWWSDGRQKCGLDLVAPGLVRVMEGTNARMAHIQYAHHAPLTQGLKTPEDKAARSARLSAYLESDRGLDAEGNLRVLRDATRPATVHLECYAPGAYADSVSDVPLLRAAAMGVPSITARSQAPPGCLAAPPDRWGETIEEVLLEPGRRRALSLSARSWAESRSTFEAYEAVLKEVTL